MRIRSLFCRAVFVAAVVGGTTLAGTAIAGASPVGPADFACGISIVGACNQTAHFNTPDPLGGIQFGGPSPNATNCPSYVLSDAPAVTGTGQGIEHTIVNNNLDGWTTTTFTGNVSVAYWTTDSDGNPVAPDPNTPTLTGHITEWFGGSFNSKNFVIHDTINFIGTAPDGTPVTFHALDHTSLAAAAGAAPVDFHVASC